MKKTIFTLLLAFFAMSTISAKDFNVTEYGAVGDGETLSTKGVQAAIDACTANGGGRVVIPGGETFIIGTIHLKENVHLHLESGSTLKSTLDFSQYTNDTFGTRYSLESNMDTCLIYAEDADNISIDGYGTIDGNGLIRYFGYKIGRPMLLRFLRCDNFHVHDITLINPASWTTDWVYCNNITISDVKVNATLQNNGAALCFDGCTEVNVTNCDFETSDDAIAITASAKDKPCKNMTFSNCTFTGKWSAFRIGLMSLGDFESITVTNCTFTDVTDAGFKIQMNEGAEMKNMVFSNIVMKNVPRPLLFTFCQQRVSVDAPEDTMLPYKSMHHFNINNMIIDNSGLDKESMMVITGMPGHYITDIQLSDIQMIVPGGGTAEDAQKRDIKEFTLETLVGRWPEYAKLGTTIPASALYARHVDYLYVNNFQIKCAGEEQRAPIVLDDVPNYVMNEVYYQGKKLESVVEW